MYRMVIDEVGHHDMKSSGDLNQRYLGLCCVVMRLDYADDTFADKLNVLKRIIFGTPNVVLHRKELLPALPPFTLLNNPEKRTEFNARLLALMRDATYTVITVVIDKQEHKEKYQIWRHQPYHYCLQLAIERYVMHLDSLNSIGDVMIESRAEKDNMKLEAAYKLLYNNGISKYKDDGISISAKRVQARLSSKEIKIKPKAANIAGLQLADLLANPSVRGLICNHTSTKMEAAFGKQVVEILKKRKYRRSWWGEIEGYGTKWLP